jgi:hypothetical protein
MLSFLPRQPVPKIGVTANEQSLRPERINDLQKRELMKIRVTFNARDFAGVADEFGLALLTPNAILRRM